MPSMVFMDNTTPLVSSDDRGGRDRGGGEPAVHLRTALYIAVLLNGLGVILIPPDIGAASVLQQDCGCFL